MYKNRELTGNRSKTRLDDCNRFEIVKEQTLQSLKNLRVGIVADNGAKCKRKPSQPDKWEPKRLQAPLPTARKAVT